MIFYILNLVMAAALGWTLGGWRGAALALLIVAVVIGAPAVLHRAGPRPRKLGRAVLLTVSLPLAGIAMVIALGVLWIVKAIGARLPMPRDNRPIFIPLLAHLTAIRFGLRPIGSLVKPEVLPWSLANVVLLLVLACAVEGVTVALYVALLAVPVMLLGLVMLALESGEPTTRADE